MGFLEDRVNLQGKAALITGGAGGLGRGIALDLARAGVNVAIGDRDDAAVQRTSTELADLGVGVVAQTIDARDPEALGGLFSALDDAFGRIDVLVNVVGGTFKSDFADTNPRGWDAIIRTNFMHVLHATSMAVQRMKAAGRGGSIINLTSIEAHRAAPGFAVYSGMKAGVAHFARTLAVELAPLGIRVNNIAPDMVPTEGVAAIQGNHPPVDPALEALGDRLAIPMARKGRLEDVGSCALFLASDLSTYITGTTLHPDGGAFASSGWFNWPDDGFRNTVPAPILGHLS